MEQVERDRVLVVGMQQLGALVGELGEPAVLAGGLLLGLLAHAGERLVELFADRVCLAGWHRDMGV
ncbi:MAG TPA: hypothetical protein VGP17_07680 [Solirubrobacteraceae bacterium]|nr:hypothetical protein [Solirubrobacteraceae bacterium]